MYSPTTTAIPQGRRLQPINWTSPSNTATTATTTATQPNTRTKSAVQHNARRRRSTASNTTTTRRSETPQRRRGCDPTQHDEEVEEEYNTTTTTRRRTVRPKPTDKEVEEQRGPTQHTSPIPTLRDPTMIGVSPSTRRVGEIEGVEGKGVEMGGDRCNPHKGERKAEPCPSVSFIFSYITCT
jgi:hypothetical protein